MSGVNYDAEAPIYARERRVHEFLVDEIARGVPGAAGPRVLEVGCGPGGYLKALLALTQGLGVGLDASRGMLAQAGPADGPCFVQGAADRLPFRVGAFDLVYSIDVIHHLVDGAAYFQEASRLLAPGGRVLTITDSADIIAARQPMVRYWPETVAVDLERYPGLDRLFLWMRGAGFSRLAARQKERAFTVEDISPYRAKAFSMLHLIPQEAFARGLRQMEADLARGPIPGVTRYVCVWGQKPPPA